jgi:hypothetical protein
MRSGQDGLLQHQQHQLPQQQHRQQQQQLPHQRHRQQQQRLLLHQPFVVVGHVVRSLWWLRPHKMSLHHSPQRRLTGAH